MSDNIKDLLTEDQAKTLVDSIFIDERHRERILKKWENMKFIKQNPVEKAKELLFKARNRLNDDGDWVGFGEDEILIIENAFEHLEKKLQDKEECSFCNGEGVYDRPAKI